MLEATCGGASGGAAAADADIALTASAWEMCTFSLFRVWITKVRQFRSLSTHPTNFRNLPHYEYGSHCTTHSLVPLNMEMEWRGERTCQSRDRCLAERR